MQNNTFKIELNNMQIQMRVVYPIITKEIWTALKIIISIIFQYSCIASLRELINKAFKTCSKEHKTVKDTESCVSDRLDEKTG